MSNTRTNPYVGPRPFQTGEKMYGRERETRELLNLLIAERIVLLYSPSGAGKTSLIQAALFPKLREEEFVVLPPMRVSSEPPVVDKNEARPAFNRYVLSTLLSLEEAQPREKRLPLAQLAQMTFDDYLKQRADLQDKNPVLLFDQFEEILTLAPMDRETKFAFFAQIGDALRDRSRWALFAMREDYIAGLDPFLLPIPTRFSTRYRLDLLGVSAARDAIQKPARDSGVNFTNPAAEKLINDLRQVQVQRPDGTMETQPGLYVEPVQLQVVCLRLWNNLPATKNEIAESDIAQVGDVNSALASYYQLRVSAVAVATGESERTIREWFDRQLITEAGVRGQVLKEPERSRGLSNAAIRMLEDAHLVRADERRGATWFELAHDRLIAPIRDNNATWFQQNLSALQLQADLWERQGRPDGLLLRGKALDDAEEWMKQHHRADLLTATEVAFLNESRQERFIHEKQERQQRRIRNLAFGATALSVIAIIGICVALISLAQLGNSLRETDEARADAIAKGDEANSARLQAQLQERVSKMVSAALAQLDVDPEEGLVIATEAYSTTHNLQTDDVLRQALNASRVRGTMQTGSSIVSALAFDPNGKFIISASGDGMLHKWDAANGNLLFSWQGHDGAPIWGIAISADGNFLATSGEDGTARLWDLRACDEKNCAPREFTGHEGAVWGVSFNPDNTLLVTAGNDKTAKIWDVATGQVLRTLSGHYAPINAAVISPNGRYVVTASSDQTARIWDLSACADTCPYQEIQGQAAFWNAAFSPDSKFVVLAGDDQNAYKYDVTTGSLLNYLTGHTDAVFGIAYSPDGKAIATGSRDGTARVWDAETGQTFSVLRGHEGTIWNVAFSPDSQLLLTASADGTAKLWNAAQSEDLIVLRGQLNRILGAAFSGDGKRAITASADRTARVWELPNGNLALPPLTGHTGWVTDGALNRDGTRAATSSYDGTARLWDLNCYPQCEPLVLQGHEAEVRSVAFSPDETLVVTASDDKTAKIWDAKTGALVQTLSGHTAPVNHASFSPDGKQILTASTDNSARVWDVATGTEIRSLDGHTAAINSALFNPDGTLIVTASNDRSARVWDAASGQEKLQLEGHAGPVTFAVFTADGKRIVTGSADKTARVWDAASGQQTGILRGHTDKIQTVEVSPDDRYVMTASSDKTVRLALLDIAQVLQLAQKRATRNLLCEEWASILQDNNYCPGGAAKNEIAFPTLAPITRIAIAPTQEILPPPPATIVNTATPAPTQAPATIANAPTETPTNAPATIANAPTSTPTNAPTPTLPATPTAPATQASSPTIEPTQLAPTVPPTPALPDGVYVSKITYVPLDAPNFKFKITFVNTTGADFNITWLVPFFEPGAKNSIGAPKGTTKSIPAGTSELETEPWRVGVGQCTTYNALPAWQDSDGKQTQFQQTNQQPAALDFQLCP